MFVRNCTASSGTSTLAGANEKATKLMSDPVMKMAMPQHHMREVCGLARTSSDICSPSACIFCPVLISTEPPNPSITPMSNANAERPSSHVASTPVEFELTRGSAFGGGVRAIAGCTQPQPLRSLCRRRGAGARWLRPFRPQVFASEPKSRHAQAHVSSQVGTHKGVGGRMAESR
eukprot:1781705-Prymnesium_polylepis.1